IICLPAFRHITQILLDLRQQACVEFRQSDEKLDGASDAQGSCGVALRPGIPAAGMSGFVFCQICKKSLPVSRKIWGIC
ncbi:MAG: hypothetical protein IJR91_05335, partial [Ruminococcus sp.]|nr:hypothetical protein [Ruminococcus sp.]